MCKARSVNVSNQVILCHCRDIERLIDPHIWQQRYEHAIMCHRNRSGPMLLASDRFRTVPCTFWYVNREGSDVQNPPVRSDVKAKYRLQRNEIGTDPDTGTFWYVWQVKHRKAKTPKVKTPKVRKPTTKTQITKIPNDQNTEIPKHRQIVIRCLSRTLLFTLPFFDILKCVVH